MDRPHRRRHVGAFLFAGIAVVALASAGMALSNGGRHAIRAVSRSDAGATHLARAIFEGNKHLLVRAKFVTVPPGNDPVAISRKRLVGFPRRGHAFAILTTGCARLADNPNTKQYSGCKDGGLKIRGARDVTMWRIRVKVPKGDNCLSFRFKFLSEEFPEFVKSIYNDAFIAELGVARWNASGKVNPTIHAPGNFATTANGKLISVNGAGVARVSRGRAKGTTYDAATRKLRASTPIKPGSHLLTLSIFDQGDRQYDSAVFIDRLLVRHAANCHSGVVGTK